MRYRPELDGMRAVAVLAVMASHTGVGFCEGGWMGVTVFFVLSGYLITTLVLSEHDRTGRVSLRAFYERRVLRLYPALLTVIAVLGIVFGLGLRYGSMSAYVLTAIRSGLYLEDFGGSAGAPALLPHTWSLAIEEQFYLVWPPILVWLLSRGARPLRWALAGTAASWAALAYYVWRAPAVNAGSPTGPGALHAYFLPWSRFGELLVGCSLALLLARAATPPVAIRSRAVGYCVAVAGVGVVYLGQYAHRASNLWWEAPAMALITVVAIWFLTVTDATGLRNLLGCGVLRWIGQRSYGIYLIHLPVLLMLSHHLRGAHRSELCALMVATTAVLAALSYRYVETPFLRRKRHLGSGELTTVASSPRPSARISGPDRVVAGEGSPV